METNTTFLNSRESHTSSAYLASGNAAEFEKMVSKALGKEEAVEEKMDNTGHRFQERSTEEEHGNTISKQQWWVPSYFSFLTACMPAFLSVVELDLEGHDICMLDTCSSYH